jgi:hypothetical protein
MSDVINCNLIQVGGRTYRMHTPALISPVAKDVEMVDVEDDYYECSLEDDASIFKENDLFALHFKVDQEV